MYLYDLPPHKKNVPELVKDPVALIKDVRSLVERHCKDNPELAVTGCPVLKPCTSNVTPLSFDFHEKFDSLKTYESDVITEHTSPSVITNTNVATASKTFFPPAAAATTTPTKVCGPRGPYKKNSGATGQSSSKSGSEKEKREGSGSNSGPRRRRTRCKMCEACQRSDCSECSFCLDMVKFGGPGRAKQTCMRRQCLQPMLPVTAQCVYCHLDGWRQTPLAPQAKLQATLEGPSSLMECSVCYEIAHADCAQKHTQNTNGVVNEDLPNSWECPICCKSGKNTDYKVRIF